MAHPPRVPLSVIINDTRQSESRSVSVSASVSVSERPSCLIGHGAGESEQTLKLLVELVQLRRLCVPKVYVGMFVH